MLGYIRNSITRKISLIVGGVCLFVTLAGLSWMILLLRSDIVEHSRQSLSAVTSSLRAGFHAVDPQSNSHPIAGMLEEFSVRDEIEKLQIFNAEGEIVWSLDEDERGHKLPPEVLLRFRSGHTFTEADTDEKIIESLQRVRAERSCLKCHAKNKGMGPGVLLGGIHIKASFARLTSKLVGYGNLQIVTALLLVALVIVITALMVRIFIGQPLQKITHVVQKAEQGDFLNRIEAEGNDEIARLGRELNQLLARLTDAEASKIDSDLELDAAQRELRLKAQLEEKNKIIEETNQKLTSRLSQLALVYDINSALASSLELDQVIGIITEKIGNELDFEGFYVLLTDEDQKNLAVRAAMYDERKGLIGRLIDPLRGTFTKSLRVRKILLINDLSGIVREGDDLDLLPETGSFLSLPLLRKGQVLGLLNFTRSVKDGFPHDAVRLLTAVAHQAAMTILNARLYQQKIDLSVTDELTQLANRRLMQSRLEREWDRANRYQNALSVLMIDIDHFKKYNDRNGHLLGDEVLKGVARILEGNTRKIDTVARFGGEEFVVILPGQDKPSAFSVADKLRSAVQVSDFPRASVQPGGRLTISVGVASYPEDANDSASLLERSDLALYASKRAGRNRTTAYDEEVQKISEERRRQLEAGMSRKRRKRRKSKSRLEFIDPT